jgi:large subunit ribosomal protein L1
MGKIRAAVLGDEESEKEAKRKADARRQTKKSKKGGSDNADSNTGTDVKPEFKKLVDEVEADEGKTQNKKGKGKKEKVITPHRHSKKYLEAKKLVDKNKLYPIADAIALIKKTSISKFDGSVEMHINLNINGLNGKKDYRGSVSLPHGTGKQVKVVVADEALIAKVADGKIEFDILVAHPSMMPKLAKVARILGPKGLMPNPKTGTVTVDVEKRVKELSQGQINFKTEPENPIVHLAIGKVSFENKKLSDNITAVIVAIGKNKITSISLAPSMGPGVKVQL